MPIRESEWIIQFLTRIYTSIIKNKFLTRINSFQICAFKENDLGWSRSDNKKKKRLALPKPSAFSPFLGGAGPPIRPTPRASRNLLRLNCLPSDFCEIIRRSQGPVFAVHLGSGRLMDT